MTKPSTKTYIIHQGVVVAIIDHTQMAVQTIELKRDAIAQKDTEFYEENTIVTPEQHAMNFKPWTIRTPREFSGDIDRLVHPTKR